MIEYKASSSFASKDLRSAQLYLLKIMSSIQFFSTNGHPQRVDFKAALLMGQAPDKGLYMPEQIPLVPRSLIDEFPEMSYPQIAREVMMPYLGHLVPEQTLRSMLQDAYNYDVPVEKV